jgi:DNA-directed RNA polymerase subunit L
MKKLLLCLFASENELHIIHFDDPFGETMERRTDAFAKELDTFLHLARGCEHLRIIVTSRLNIFRESMALAHNRAKVEEFEKDIRVHTSYRRDILLDILHRYIQFYKPLWAGDKKIIATLNDQLPDLLPAPHNIEFFVRTSERFDSLEDVLRHVENSKKMIKAIGEWMSSLPDHEQFFLMWLEICSTTNILFPNTSASKMDFESAYKETLAYLFKRNYIAGIQISPFSRAKDKFDMILLENRDKDVESSKFDFVHPSYHEAFWYAIQHKLSLNRRWELLKEKIEEILKDLENKVDIVQLRMIERYGSINRDVDQLLLLSAESVDKKEQLIAFEHMLEHPEKFLPVPQFSHCARSVISSDKILNSTLKDKFLRMIDNCFEQLPQDILKTVPSFAFDSEPEIRLETEKIILKYNDKIPDLIKQSEAMQDWMTLNNLLSISEKSPLEREHDTVTTLLESHESLSEDETEQFFNIIKKYELFSSLDQIQHQMQLMLRKMQRSLK